MAVSSESLAKGSAVARAFLGDLSRLTADPPGVTRIAYGEGEARAFALAAETTSGWGAEVLSDAAGNQFITLPGLDRTRRIIIGSHLDSVPHGGDYDGTAGVALGLAMQAALHGEDATPAFDLTVACLRAEESCWFPHSYIGSKTALGVLEQGVLDSVRRSDTGLTLAEHIARAGFDPQAVARGARLFDPAEILAYIEPHIEQADHLADLGQPLASVTAIRGSFRYRAIRIAGQYAHSGATPRRLRRDAAMAGAHLMTAMHALWERLEAEGHDLTVTFGQVGTDPAQHSFSKVAGRADLCLDVRSQSVETLALAETELEALARRCADRFDVEIDLGARSGSSPAVMNPRLLGMMREACVAADIAPMTMASGAGHDAATFAQAGIPSGMIFIRNRNGSHNPDEAIDLDDLDRALAVLARLVSQPATDWTALREEATA